MRPGGGLVQQERPGGGLVQQVRSGGGLVQQVWPGEGLEDPRQFISIKYIFLIRNILHPAHLVRK